MPWGMAVDCWGDLASALGLSLLLSACGDRGEDEKEPETRLTDAAVAEFQGCAGSPIEFEIGRSVAGSKGLLSAAVIEASPFPPRKYDNSWTIELTGGDGIQLEDATLLAIKAYMPGHDHYAEGADAPTFEPLSEPSRFGAQMKFPMRGYWQVGLEASSDASTDYVMFHVCVED